MAKGVFFWVDIVAGMRVIYATSIICQIINTTPSSFFGYFPPPFTKPCSLRDDQGAGRAAPPSPFFAFPLGSNLTLKSFVTAGISGVVLGLACVIITGFAGYFVYKLLKMERPQVGAAIGTAAGNSASTPAALLAVGAITETVSASATAQISACIIVTAILCPLLVTWLDSIEKKRHPERYLPEAVAEEAAQ